MFCLSMWPRGGALKYCICSTLCFPLLFSLAGTYRGTWAVPCLFRVMVGLLKYMPWQVAGVVRMGERDTSGREILLCDMCRVYDLEIFIISFCLS